MQAVLHLRRPTGSIIGREDDVRAVLGLFDSYRLVNLVGPGGVGKTSLAAEVVHELEPELARVVTVELAETEHPGDVLRLLAASVLDETSLDEARIAAALDAVPTLLVVDNCEHVIDDAAAVLAGVLAATTDTRALATSRRPLQIAAEALWTLSPLSLPDADDSDRALAASPAVQLFLERVCQAVPTFELTGANRHVVAAICTATDGIPLALELAAALVRTQPLDAILRAMIEDPSGVTSTRRDIPGHQRSLGASLDWSYRFLSPDDNDLLDRLSVFVGGFTAEAASAVTGCDPERLSTLVDHSLMTFDATEARYRILEVIRRDTASRLTEPVAASLYRRHLEWCQSIVADIDATRFEPDPDNRFPLFGRELPNLCAAIRRCHRSGNMDGFRNLLGPIAVWWVHQLPPDDPEMWSDAFATSEAPLSWRGNVAAALSFFWSHRDDHLRALELAEDARVLHDQAADVLNRSLDEIAIANALVALDRPDEGRLTFEQALSSAKLVGSAYPELLAKVSLARLDPDNPGSETYLTDALQMARPGFGLLESIILSELGLRALNAGRLDDAKHLCNQALELARTNGYGEAIGTALCALGEVSTAAGDIVVARAAYGEALAIGQQSSHAGVSARALAGIEALPVARDAANTAVAGALPPEDPLSDRELSVLRLLRGDLTQREIADELYIAPSTVKTHIKAIYRKLGVNKRAHAVTRAAELGLIG